MFRDTTLHRARLASGLTIDDVATATRLSPRLVKLIDEGRLHDLPGGLYARSYVRAFARATGIDPDAAVARVEQMLPEAPDPIAALRGSLGNHDPETAPVVADLKRVWTTMASRARMTLGRPVAASPLSIVARRSAGACVDTLLLAALNGIVLRVVAGFSGATVSALLQANGAAVAIFCALMSMMYYVLLAGIGGGTPGTRLGSRQHAGPSAPLRPAAILGRAGRAWFGQSSIIVDVLLYVHPAPVKSLLSRLDVIRHRAA